MSCAACSASSEQAGPWECEECNQENEASDAACCACDAPRPSAAAPSGESSFKVARVIECEPVQGKDKLKQLLVDVGAAEPIQVPFRPSLPLSLWSSLSPLVLGIARTELSAPSAAGGDERAERGGGRAHRGGDGGRDGERWRGGDSDQEGVRGRCGEQRDGLLGADAGLEGGRRGHGGAAAGVLRSRGAAAIQQAAA